MAQPSIWFRGTDMYVQVAGLQTSTMGSTEFLTASTGMTLNVWRGESTSSTGNRLITNTNIPYHADSSSGRYRVTIQSTAYAFAKGNAGMAVITLSHSALNREWRPLYRVDYSR